MNQDDIIANLSSRREDFARFDVASLSVFGSFARGTATAASDIDVLVRFATTPTFDRYMDLKAMIESVTGRRVDLVTDSALRPEMRPQIEREAIRVA